LAQEQALACDEAKRSRHLQEQERWHVQPPAADLLGQVLDQLLVLRMLRISHC
jgi:hypothetical protein